MRATMPIQQDRANACNEPGPFRTRITELFGIRLPVLAGGLQWLADAQYVAAAVNAGIMGFITAASFPDDESLTREIRKCRDLTEGKPFGVNISMLPKLAAGDRVERIVDVVAREKVAFVETSGRSPEPYIPRLRAAGIKVIHKIPSLRYAKSAEAAGVDAIALVGYECGGHPGLDLVGSFVQAALAERKLSLPYVIGGGVGCGSQLVAALAMGADGVIVGTRFLVAEEIRAHSGYKEKLLAAQETDTTLVMQSVRNTVRIMRNETARIVQEIEERGEGAMETLLPHVAGAIGRQAYLSGDWSKGALAMGMSVAFADKVEPLAAILERFEREADAALERLEKVRRRAPQS